MDPQKRIPVIVLLIVAVALAVLGVVYLTTPAAHLPTWLPGHLATHTQRNGHVVHPSAHVGRGVALLGAAVIVVAITWWYAYRYNPETASNPS
jgi:amino acid permease